MITAALIGFALALNLTQQILEHYPERSAFTIGTWQVAPFDILSTHVISDNPYEKAANVRQRALSMGAGEGVRFYAFNSSNGEPLQSNCTYTISGELPSSKHWTLSAVGLDVSQHNTLLERVYSATRLAEHGTLGALTPVLSEDAAYINSSWVVWDSSDTITIKASTTVQGGNWLSLPTTNTFMFVLHLYEMTDNFDMIGDAKSFKLPDIDVVDCP